MSDTAADIQLARFDRLNQSLEELKTRFDLLAEAGNKLQQSFEAMKNSLILTNHITPIMVPLKLQQMGTAEQGDHAGGQKFGENIALKLVENIVGALVDVSFKKLLKDREPAKTKDHIGFRGPQEGEASSSSWLARLAAFRSVLGGPVSKAGLGATSALVLGTAAAAYGAGSLLSNAIHGTSQKTPSTTGDRQAESAIAALPVVVMNWPPGFGTSQGGSGGTLQKIVDEALKTVTKKMVEKLFETGADKGAKAKSPIGFERAQEAGKGLLSLIGRAPSFLPSSWLARLASMGGPGAALAAPVGTAGAATTAGLVAATAAAGYGVGTLLNKGMGWVSDKLSGGKYGGEGWLGSMAYDLLHPSETQVQNQNTINVALKVDKDNRLHAMTNDMNTQVNLNRGQLLIGD